VSVQVELCGEGNLPTKLKVPSQKGIDCLEPTGLDHVSVRGGRIGGTRTFSYVVRLTEPGRIDLGEITLPFFNPSTERYEVAKAPLGSVEVSGSPKQEDAQNQAGTVSGAERLLALSSLRRDLGAKPEPKSYLSDTPSFFLWVLVPPGLVGLGFVLLAAGRRARSRLRAREASKLKKARAALGEAKSMAKDGKQGDAASEIERALYLALEGVSGVKARGLLRHELPGALAAVGLSDELGQNAVRLLERCDSMRFTKDDAIGVEDLLDRADQFLSALGKLEPPKGVRS
jgi:hypothetical protein